MKITFHKDRTLTVHRVDASTFSSILTAAVLHAYHDSESDHQHRREERKRAEANEYNLGDVIRRNITLEDQWYKNLRRTIAELQNLLISEKYRHEIPELRFEKVGELCAMCGGFLINGECVIDAKLREKEEAEKLVTTGVVV